MGHKRRNRRRKPDTSSSPSAEPPSEPQHGSNRPPETPAMTRVREALARHHIGEALQAMKDAYFCDDSCPWSHFYYAHILYEAYCQHLPSSLPNLLVASLDAARRASALIPSDLEFSRLYASILYSAALDDIYPKGYAAAMDECDRSLSIGGAADPSCCREELQSIGKESLATILNKRYSGGSPPPPKKPQGAHFPPPLTDHAALEGREPYEILVQSLFDSMTTWTPGSFVVTVSSIKNHFSTVPPYSELLTRALAFARAKSSWKIWPCSFCGYESADFESYRQHLQQQHMPSLPSNLEANFPPRISHEWAEMITSDICWAPVDVDVDVHAAAEMLQKQPQCRHPHAPQRWPQSDDPKRTELLNGIRIALQLLLESGNLCAQHTKHIIQSARESVHSNLPFGEDDPSPLFIRFLPAKKLQSILDFLQELSRSCDLRAPSEIDSLFGNAILDDPGRDVAESVSLEQGASVLILDPNLHGDEETGVPDKGSLVSWLYGGQSPRESLTAWNQMTKQRRLWSAEVLDVLSKKANILRDLCCQKSNTNDHVDASSSLKIFCLEELKKRGSDMDPMPQKLEDILRKLKEEIIEKDDRKDDPMLDVISDVLRVLREANEGGEADESDVDDDSRMQDYSDQEERHITKLFRNLDELSNLMLDKTDAMIMYNSVFFEKLELKLCAAPALDYRTVVVPFTKTFLRLSCEDAAKLYAIKPSEAAFEARLVEENDAEKSTVSGDNAKEGKKESKDKKKAKYSKKFKGKKAVGCNEQFSLQEPSEQPKVLPAIDGKPVKPEHVTIGCYVKELEEKHMAKPKIEDLGRKLEEMWLKDAERESLLTEQKKATTSTDSAVDQPCPADSSLNTDYIGEQEEVDWNKQTDLSAENSQEGAVSGEIHCFESAMPTTYHNTGNQSSNVINHSEASSEKLSAIFYPEISSLEEDYVAVTNDAINDILIAENFLGKGLKNEVGEANCFLNVIIQSLWHIRRFRDEFHETMLTHKHVGGPCVICALYDVFADLSKSSEDTMAEPVDPAPLRLALSNLNHKKFKMAEMGDAQEVLETILNCLHWSCTSSGGDCTAILGDINYAVIGDCKSNNCIAHALFGLEFHDSGSESWNQNLTLFVHLTYATELRTGKNKYADKSFEELMKNIEKDLVPCEMGANYGKPILSRSPHVFTTVLVWQHGNESAENISATLDAISTEVDIGVLFGGIGQGSNYSLIFVVCYCERHYICFAYSAEDAKWIMYDDKTVEVAGTWNDVCTLCIERKLQPTILFFEGRV